MPRRSEYQRLARSDCRITKVGLEYSPQKGMTPVLAARVGLYLVSVTNLLVLLQARTIWVAEGQSQLMAAGRVVG